MAAQASLQNGLDAVVPICDTLAAHRLLVSSPNSQTCLIHSNQVFHRSLRFADHGYFDLVCKRNQNRETQPFKRLLPGLIQSLARYGPRIGRREFLQQIQSFQEEGSGAG